MTSTQIIARDNNCAGAFYTSYPSFDVGCIIRLDKEGLVLVRRHPPRYELHSIVHVFIVKKERFAAFEDGVPRDCRGYSDKSSQVGERPLLLFN